MHVRDDPMRTGILALILWLGAMHSAAADDPRAGDRSPMTEEYLASLVRSMAPAAAGIEGALTFRFSGVEIRCISDTEHDRMRLIAVITPVSKLTGEQIGRILEANFHTALDARYATSQGNLYAAFLHPLSALTEVELRSAVSQVANLVRTFGATYSSGELVYRSGDTPI